MNNILLGKTIKAMYKLSGKTLSRISEETDLTVDTINNLFYARIQKPSLGGVEMLVKDLGFTMQDLLGFLDANPNLPESADVTDLFTKYHQSVCDAVPAASSAISAAPSADTKSLSPDTMLRSDHEKAIELLRESHKEQVLLLQESADRSSKQYESTISSISSFFESSRERLEGDLKRLRKLYRVSALLFAVGSVIILLLLCIDFLNRSVGWLR